MPPRRRSSRLWNTRCSRGTTSAPGPRPARSSSPGAKSSTTSNDGTARRSCSRPTTTRRSLRSNRTQLKRKPPRFEGKPRSARPLRSGPITGPSPLLRAGPPLCPGSVLCRARLPPAGVLPLAGRAAQPAHLGQVGTGTTGSPVPCQRLRRAHATYTPDTTRPARRPPPGSQHTTTIGCAFIPGTPDNPGFDAIVLFFRCVSSGSHTFVFSSPT